MERREFLKIGLTAPAGMALSHIAGCATNVKGLREIAAGGNRNQPLIIDTHAHLFNGTDLHVSEFIGRVAISESDNSAIRFLASVLGSVLENIVWSIAPDANRELEELAAYPHSPGHKTLALHSVAGSRQTQYLAAKTELARVAELAITKANRNPESYKSSLTSLSDEDQALAALLRLPETYEALSAEPEEKAFSLSSSLRKINAARKFLVEMFQYRHVSAVNYFNTYSSQDRSVDLVTPSLVDYDWWLAGGRSTHSKMPEQVAVNGRIAAMSGGRIHPLFGFDPFRQIMWDRHGIGEYSPLELMKHALEKQGFIGVKLYPPMGFAMYNNARFTPESRTIWGDKKWLHDIAKNPQFAAQLDSALDRLYNYCEINSIPVLAHSSRSNMADSDFEPLLLAESWESMYSKYPITGSFGHFSGFAEKPEEHWRQFVKLLLEEQQKTQPRRYADASYFASLFSNMDATADLLRTILFDDQGNRTSLFSQLLYGSDWKMLLLEPASHTYMDLMIATLKKADTRFEKSGFQLDLQNRVMGQNAANYLGLRRGMKTRERLEIFYARFGIEPPIWMAKVDMAAAA